MLTAVLGVIARSLRARMKEVEVRMCWIPLIAGVTGLLRLRIV